MGIAILSGVLDSLTARNEQGGPARSSTPTASGASTPVTSYLTLTAEASIPSRFIACVTRVESVRRLKKTFKEMGSPLAGGVEVLSGENLRAVQESDVILLWSAGTLYATVYHHLTNGI